jgi:hypothetical protein
MPKLSLPGVLAATLVFWLIGFLWYGVLFADAWMTAEGVTAADAENQSPLWMAAGVLMTLAQVLGLALVLKWKGVYDLADAVKTAALLWALFALPLALYDFVYLTAHNLSALAIDAGHLFAGWVAAAAVLSRFR